MKLKGLVDLLPSVPAFAEWLAQLQSAQETGPQAVLAAARPCLVAALAAHWPAPILLITARSEMAQQVSEQLLTWLPPLEEGGAPVYHFADPDAMPYERISWSSATRQRRLSTLAVLQGRTSPAPIVVASARALMQKTLPARELRLALRTIKSGAPVRLEQLIAGWVQTGYNPVEIVEEPGAFARRGGIIDIWPPNLRQPVRIDLFGDEVESLRLFDPTTQRTIRPVESIEIGPGSELLSKYGPAILERLNLRQGSLMAPAHFAAAADGEESPPDSPLRDGRLMLTLREELRLEVDHLAAGQSFHGSEWYLPYAYGQPAGLLDYVGSDGLVLLDEPLDLFATLSELEMQAEALRAELERAGELPRGFARSYFTPDELRAAVAARRPAILGYGDLFGKSASGNTPLARCFAPGTRFGGKTKEIAADMVKLHNAGHSAVLLTRQAARLTETLAEFHLAPQLRQHLAQPPAGGEIILLNGVLGEGFILRNSAAGGNVHFYTDTELYGWSKPQARPRSKTHSTVAPELFFADVKTGEYVVHIEHGIGMFDGLVRMQLGGMEREYLQVSYARGDKLYVPVHQADRLSRYVGAGEAQPPVTRLGTADWAMVKERAKRAVAEIAEDLLKLYAQRETIKGHVYSVDSPWQEEMEAAFPFQETDDQLHAVDAVKRDMESERPMDRLICGDVGYGKTEVAIRAAFKAINDGKQVAFLVPTTVLAQQHYRNIAGRLHRFPVRVEVLSRFRTAAQQQRVIDGLHAGSVDLVVGTHRLLSQDVEFKDLGLLIIDEEQRFGVSQKEQLKQLRAKVDVLTLSATPIPRTLHMSLSGIRDMSTINTPPKERLPIHTVLAEYDDLLVKGAIERELGRKGQVFVVTDRVRGIHALADRIQRLAPNATVSVGHGQMHERELEDAMVRFADGEVDVLVATTIIENGLDIPNANTIIINRADHFGLAQLYQLRGRVGRSTQRGYCYLLYDRGSVLSYDARRRLQAVLESSEELGAGFRIAMRDLEIRGAGELLGARQHGHIDSVGFDLYTRLLAQAINEARRKKQRFDQAVGAEGEDGAPVDGAPVDGSIVAAVDGTATTEPVQAAAKPPTAPAESSARQAAAVASDDSEDDEPIPFDLADPLAPPVTLDLPLDARIPAWYIEDEELRLQLYRRIAGITHPDLLDEMGHELLDRFGKDAETGDLPEEIDNLFFQIRVKIFATRAGVDRIGRDLEQLVLHSDVLENMDRKLMQRRLRLGLGKLSEDDNSFVPEEAARVGRRAIYLPIDEVGRWREVLLRTLQIMAVG